MPPRNAARTLLTETALAARVAYEREVRGWTYDGLAKRMTDVGCAINQSGLYKIERGEPRRRITVDELVAFSQVFEIPVEQLLLPPELALSRRLGELFIAWNYAAEAAARTRADEDAALAALKEHVAAHPEIAERVEAAAGKWAEIYRPEDRDLHTDLLLYKITNDPDRSRIYRERVRAATAEVDHG